MYTTCEPVPYLISIHELYLIREGGLYLKPLAGRWGIGEKRKGRGET